MLSDVAGRTTISTLSLKNMLPNIVELGVRGVGVDVP
jgi:hypothetical protein